MRKAIGVVRFRDLRFDIEAEIVITQIPEIDATFLLLDQGGDCEVGFDLQNTERLMTAFRTATLTVHTKSHAWRSIGEAEFSWSDHNDQSTSGEDYGTVLIESSGPKARMIIRTKNWTKNWADIGGWGPYVATFSSSTADEFSTLLLVAVRESSAIRRI